MLKILFVLILITTSCTSGRYDKLSLRNITSGSFKLGKAENQSVHHAFRALGQPAEHLDVAGTKYYRWKHERFMGVSYFLLGGVNTTMYCFFTLETNKRNKIKYATWYGNDCSVYLDNFKSYFKNNLKAEIEIDEETKTEFKDGGINSENKEIKQEDPVKLEKPNPEQKDENTTNQENKA